MEITDSFRVSTPIDETWKVLLDIERIAPCLPGAKLEEIDGDEFRGYVKVKVGPITAQYKGTAKLAEVDEAQRRILIDASGRDTRGQGNASAKILVTMTGDAAGTEVAVIFVEQPTGGFKLSFRSRTPRVDCNELAKRFGGGGHKAAAGASIDLPWPEAETKVLDAVRNAMR